MGPDGTEALTEATGGCRQSPLKGATAASASRPRSPHWPPHRPPRPSQPPRPRQTWLPPRGAGHHRVCKKPRVRIMYPLIRLASGAQRAPPPVRVAHSGGRARRAAGKQQAAALLRKYAFARNEVAAGRHGGARSRPRSRRQLPVGPSARYGAPIQPGKASARRQRATLATAAEARAAPRWRVLVTPPDPRARVWGTRVLS